MPTTTITVDPLVLLSDEPNMEYGGLGLERLAKVVADVSIGTVGPFTVGIYGKWGAGKSSILQMAKKMVDGWKQENGHSIAEKITTVAFNAWQYEQESTPLIPLIASIVHELDKEKQGHKRIAKAAENLRDALRSILFGLSTKVTGKASLLGEVSFSLDSAKAIERYESLRSQWIDQQVEQSLFYNAFEVLREAQAAKGGSERHRVIVFIDDLDRCLPDKALQLLESLKLVLSQPGFVFVLAVDRRPLEAYLDKRYSGFGLNDYTHGPSYLDKIIQLPIWIPPHEKRFRDLVKSLLARDALREYRNAFRPLIPVVGLACDYNPRQLVRFLNDILVDNHLYNLVGSESGFPLGAFVVARGLRFQSEPIYQGLLKDEELCNKLMSSTSAQSLSSLLFDLRRDLDPTDIKSDLLRNVQERSSLIGLLASAAGRKWLADSALRGRVDDFLAEEREPTLWIEEQVEKALAQLESQDPEEVITGCQTLGVFGDSSCLAALELAKVRWTNNPRVVKYVSTALGRTQSVRN